MQARAAAEGARPRFDVRYVVLAAGLLSRRTHIAAGDAPRDTRVRSLLAELVVETAPWNDVTAEDTGERLHDATDSAVGAGGMVRRLVRNRVPDALSPLDVAYVSHRRGGDRPPAVVGVPPHGCARPRHVVRLMRRVAEFR